MIVRNETRVGGGLFTPEEYADVERFFAGRPDIAPTPLVRRPRLAEQLGVAELMVKDESHRCGIGAFKILGVSYAVSRLSGRDQVLACATAGNHGRAVARVARERGLRAEVYVPFDAPPVQVQAIRQEGAHVTVCPEQYDGAVEIVARDAAERGWTIVSDTSWPGYEQIPRWIMAGYTHLLAEAERQWDAMPDVVFAQAGVGGLACAVGSWLDARFGDRRPFTVCCEPNGAACLLESARAGRPVKLDGPLTTFMNGLRCAVPSPLAWPAVKNTFDAFVSVSDDQVAEAMRLLAPEVVAGPSGACGFAALRAMRDVLGDAPRVLVINTEGVNSGPAAPEA